MSYIGNTPTTQSFISGTDYFNGTGSQTAFTLSRTVASVNDIQAVVNNVVQVPNDAYTISGTTITFTSAPSAGTSNVYVRYLSTTTQAITPSQGTVSWNTLDSNVQGDLGISFKNRIINSNMAIDQRNAGAQTTPSGSGYFSLDRYGIQNNTGGSRFTSQQNAGSVTPPIGFANYLGLTSTSAYSVASGDACGIYQNIEGFNTADLNWGTANAKTVTLSFWVRSSLTGTFGGSLVNSAGNRSYVFSYTISSANTWEQKSITIAGDTSGTWVGATNGIGIALNIGIGTGTTYSGTAGSWSGTYLLNVTGNTSVVGTNGATFYLTGVQLEVGTQATTFTTAGGSYGAELALCQRYFQLITGTNSYAVLSTAPGNAYSTTVADPTVQFIVEMRTAPSMTTSAFSTLWLADASNTFTPTAMSISDASKTIAIIRTTVSSGLTQFRSYRIQQAANAQGALSFSAEL
jgi:hypothetical protein